jgi:hypothetical protein
MKYEILGSKDTRRTTLPPTFCIGPLAFETISLTQGGNVYQICCLIRVEHNRKGNISQVCQHLTIFGMLPSQNLPFLTAQTVQGSFFVQHFNSCQSRDCIHKTQLSYYSTRTDSYRCTPRLVFTSEIKEPLTTTLRLSLASPCFQTMSSLLIRGKRLWQSVCSMVGSSKAIKTSSSKINSSSIVQRLSCLGFPLSCSQRHVMLLYKWFILNNMHTCPTQRIENFFREII